MGQRIHHLRVPMEGQDTTGWREPPPLSPRWHRFGRARGPSVSLGCGGGHVRLPFWFGKTGGWG